MLITSSLFLHILGAYLLISVYRKGKKTVQQLLLMNLNITELSTSLIFLIETSVGMVEDGVSVTYTNGSSCNSNKQLQSECNRDESNDWKLIREYERIGSWILQSVRNDYFVQIYVCSKLKFSLTLS